MKLHNLEAISPLIKTMRRSLRRWWVVLVITFVVMVGYPILQGFLKSTNTPAAHSVLINTASNGGDQSSPSGGSLLLFPFLIAFLILIFLYFRNIKKNAALRRTIIDYENITQIEVFVVPYRRLLTLSKIILPLDAISLIFWPIVSIPVKFVFWINYRKIKKNFKKLRRQIAKGEKKYSSTTSIYDDPFYDFLMREGLYQEKSSLEDLSSLESTDTKTEKIESGDKEEKDEKK